MQEESFVEGSLNHLPLIAAESKKKEQKANFKKVLDETVVKRVEETKAKADADEVALREIAALEAEEEQQRKEQAEQV